MPLSENLKTIIWRPSGGLGHCLHNLAWVIRLSKRNKYKLYIYGLDSHLPFQYYASDFLNFKLTGLDVEEIKGPDELKLFYEEYKIDKKSQELVKRARYNTNIKYLVPDKSVAVICSTARAKPQKFFAFKKPFIDSILENPYKFFNNDYKLLNTKKEVYTLEISGSYTKSLGVTNKHLGIKKEDKDYINELKILKINYTTIEGAKKYVEFVEKTKNRIDNIICINKAMYGVKDKTINITEKVINRICFKNTDSLNGSYVFSIEGSFYKKLRVSNKHLRISAEDNEYFNKPKSLSITYKDINNNKITTDICEKTSKTIKDIKDIINAKYGIGKKWKDVTRKVIDECCTKTIKEEKGKTNTDDNSLEYQKNEIKSIVDSKQYIAVHFRFRDKRVAGGYVKKLREINEAIKTTKINNVFVATDSPMFFDFLNENLKDTTIFRYTNPPVGGKNIHYNSTVFKKGENLYKTILDLYTCKNASRFIPSKGSGFSSMVNEFI
tara:strand:+ start:12984 stop:14468 length:1485 start_codon:yes stop_codon:yes gene_type:complete